MPKDQYQKQLKFYQQQLETLSWQAHEAKITTVILFEGWDASGKGGTIRRLIQAVDARLYRVIPIAAPSTEELSQHYLWRFWRSIPRSGYLSIFDRSWYGRVLVERVEELIPTERWQQAYHEINCFEEQLLDGGALVIKCWMHISKDEQLRRFKERQETPWKQHKITDEDWRNREKWQDYELAVEDMVANTSRPTAPWHLIAANDKKAGRIQTLKIVCDALSARLKTQS